MKLWQKNFDTDSNIEKFTVDEDKRWDLFLAPYDVLGSMAHARMLKEVKLITEPEWQQINNGLKEILDLVSNSRFEIGKDIEDIHSQVEFMLTAKKGDTGKKLHTGRSRNDQVLLDIRLFLRDRTIDMSGTTGKLIRLLLSLSEENRGIFMPGYTHFQAAMPSSFGMWFGAYAESMIEDLELLKSIFSLLNRNPLGSAAGYGSSFPLNRQFTTDLLGFESLNVNSIYAQMGRGKTERIISSVIAQMADSLGRMAGEICLYMGQDFGFFSFPDELTTGSSIMPHKKNPDVFELIRGKCNQLKALPQEMMLITTNLPSGYHRDYQLMKGRMIWALQTLALCYEMMHYMLEHVRVNAELKQRDRYKYLYSVELINQFVREGMPFREAYKKVGEQIAAGNFKIPEHPEYTHEGSLGNLMNEKLSEKLISVQKYFENQAELISKKFEYLSGNSPDQGI